MNGIKRKPAFDARQLNIFPETCMNILVSHIKDKEIKSQRRYTSRILKNDSIMQGFIRDLDMGYQVLICKVK